jgi:TRAP-type C4-dicarboxylate transport system permease small subunit
MNWINMKWFIETEKVFSRLLAGFISLCFFCIISLIITLVILRYGFNATVVGANEFAVILFIYTSALGAAVVIGKKEHIAITYFVDKLPIPYKKMVDILNYILIAFLNGVMIWYSLRWINITGSYLTAVLRIQQAFAQVIVPIGCGVAILYCIYHIILTLNYDNKYRI